MNRAWIDGHAWWAPGTPGRPAPAGLAPNERRRAPEGVLVALHMAEAAVAMAAADAATLASVFTSAHGDLAIVDALCRTLAEDPLLLSPTRFHHSVHNAASGYWGIAAKSHAPSTALAGYTASAGAGLLEAVCQVLDEQRPVLLVGFDTEAVGPLASTNTSRGLAGFACVLSPCATASSRWSVDVTVSARTVPPPPANPMAAFAPLAAALEGDVQAALSLPLDTGSLVLHLEPLPRTRATAAGA